MSLGALVGNRSFLILLFGVLLLLPAFANQYTLFVGNLMLIYIILALGLNILVGFAGLLAFANAAIYGIGAYGTALLQVHWGWSFWIAAPVGAVLAMVIGMCLIGLVYGPLGTVLSELFPTAIRYSGSSLTFNLAGIFGASLAPYVATWLATTYGLQYVGYYLSASAILSFAGLLLTRETKDDLL